MLSIAVGTLIGLLAGILSGIFGVGGGIIMVPMLVFLGLTQREAGGTSLTALLLPASIFGVMEYAHRGEVNFRYAIGIVLGLTVGVYLGSKYVNGISNQILARLFGLLLLAVSIKFLFFAS